MDTYDGYDVTSTCRLESTTFLHEGFARAAPRLGPGCLRVTALLR
jgi:hypothetical protein